MRTNSKIINAAHQVRYSNLAGRVSLLDWVFYSENRFGTKRPRGLEAQRGSEWRHY